MVLILLLPTLVLAILPYDYYGLLFGKIGHGMVRRIEYTHKMDKAVDTMASTTTTVKATTIKLGTTTKTVLLLPLNVSVEFNGGLFLEQPSPIEIVQYFDLDIQFKPRRSKGLLFHWEDGAHRLSVFLLDGFVEVEMSLGGDDKLLKSPTIVSLNAWHSVQVYRSGKGLLMKVDKQRFMDTEVDSTDKRIIKAGKTFIGGSNIKLPAKIQAVGNFVGCIQKMRINSELLSLTHTPSRTADAGSTMTIPLSLPLCSSDPCSTAKCSPHDCVATEDLAKHSCICPFPSFGDICGSTFSMADGAMRLTGNGLMQIKDQAVMNQLNLGSGEVQLTHSRPIPEGKWTTLDVTRTKRSIRITVDNEHPVSAEAPAGSEQLNVYDSLFIGGRESRIHLRDDGFNGCIEWIKIDDSVITSPRQVQHSVNVEPCHSL
ncbi:hypothetical protein PFISCL1PPCAC_3989, partial [Pristionchus fissidentatus]